jgi:hypothetical protein
MQSSLETVIREQLTRYLSGEISLQEFQRWFISTTWDVEQSNDLAAEELAQAIELRLAEYTNGDWTEQELRGWLRSLVFVLTITFGVQITVYPSSNTVIADRPFNETILFPALESGTHVIGGPSPRYLILSPPSVESEILSLVQ